MSLRYRRSARVVSVQPKTYSFAGGFAGQLNGSISLLCLPDGFYRIGTYLRERVYGGLRLSPALIICRAPILLYRLFVR